MKFNEPMTYKELCTITNLPTVKGKARELQINKLRQQYDIEKIGRSQYIIHRQYTPKEIEYLSDLKNYSKYLTNLLLDELLKVNTPQVCYTYRELREILGMVNYNYFPVKYKKKHLNLPKDYQNEWLGISDVADEQALNYIFKKLYDQGIINYHTTYKFYKYDYDEDDNLIYNPPHIATAQEEAEMLEAQKEGLILAGLKEKKDLFTASDEKKEIYYDHVNQFIISKGYDKYSRAISITIINNLWKYADASRPRFNEIQVDRYLHSKRFRAIPEGIHQRFVEGLIKIK